MCLFYLYATAKVNFMFIQTNRFTVMSLPNDVGYVNVALPGVNCLTPSLFLRIKLFDSFYPLIFFLFLEMGGGGGGGGGASLSFFLHT